MTTVQASSASSANNDILASVNAQSRSGSNELVSIFQQ